MITRTIRQAARNLSRSAPVAIFMIACMLLTATSAKGAIHYVATNGSDANPGTIDQPFRTIKKGTAALNSGDTLYIRGGTYDEIIENWDFLGGSPESHTIIAGYENENPVIRCTNCGPYAVVTLVQSYTTVQGFTIDAINTPVDGVCAVLAANVLFSQMTCLNAARDGVRVIGENTTIRDSHIKDCGRIQTDFQDTKGLGIHANNDGGGSNTSNLLVERNLVEGCRAGGIAVHQESQTTNVVVRENIVQNFGSRSAWSQREGASPQLGHGIIFGHGSYYYAYSNLVINAGRSSGNGYLNRCFLAWGGGDGRAHGSFFSFLNNTCHDADVGIQTWDETNNVTAVNNIYSNVDYIELLNGANNTNTNYVTNPIFVNAAAGDFRLQAGSPGIDQGANLSPVVTTDMTGVSRDASYDIGAYESGVVPSLSPPEVISETTAIFEQQ